MHFSSVTTTSLAPRVVRQADDEAQIDVSTKKICLLTTAHLTNNPRLVKEANALHACGYLVTVVACRHDATLIESDMRIMQSSGWSAHIVDWSREGNPRLFWFSRFRRIVCHSILVVFRWLCRTGGPEWLEMRSIHRVLPEIRRKAEKTKADVFVGHNPGTLPIAWRIAWQSGAKCGFDAEDFHSGMTRDGEKQSTEAEVNRRWESRYLPRYDFLTAAAPLIAEEYMRRYPVNFDAVVLNVFDPARVDETGHDVDFGGLALYWISQSIGANRG